MQLHYRKYFTLLFNCERNKDSPGHDTSWHGIDMEHVLDVIPNSLYHFLSVLFGGENIFELEEQDKSMKVRISSIVQDLVYTASKSRKLTPKHVCLGLALYQATRSEKMENIFHAAGHTVGIDTLRRIDSSIIGNDNLRRYEQNGYIYIPNGISPCTPGRIILSSFDNIDVLEDTIDLENTFHATQCVLCNVGYRHHQNKRL